MGNGMPALWFLACVVCLFVVVCCCCFGCNYIHFCPHILIALWVVVMPMAGSEVDVDMAKSCQA